MGCFDWPARRWFRILWVLVAIGLLASLPVLIIQASKHDWPVQDQVRHGPGKLVCWAAHVGTVGRAALARQTARGGCLSLPAALHRWHGSDATSATRTFPVTN